MQKRNLKRTLETLGLQLVSVESGEGSGLHVAVKAGNGTVRGFRINRNSDPREDLDNLKLLRRFARDNPTSGTLPTIAELDRQHDRKEDALVNGSSTPLLREDPMPAPIEAIETFITKEDEMPMPKPTLVDNQQATKSHKAQTPRRIERMSQTDFFRLCVMLKDFDLKGIITLAQLGTVLTKEFGMLVSVSTATSALKAVDRKLDKPAPSNKFKNPSGMMVIARCLVAFMEKFDEPVPDDLRDLCGEEQ